MPAPERQPSPATPFMLTVLEQNNIQVSKNHDGETTLTQTEKKKFKGTVLGSPEAINTFLRSATNTIFSNDLAKPENTTPLTMASYAEYQALAPEQQSQARAAVATIWQEVLEDWVYIRDNRDENFATKPGKNAVTTHDQAKVVDKLWEKVHIPQILNVLTERDETDRKLYWTMDFPVKDFVYQYLETIHDLQMWLGMASYGDQAVNLITVGVNTIREMLHPDKDMPPQTLDPIDVGLRAALPGRRYRGTGNAPAPRISKKRGGSYYQLDIIGAFYTERRPTPPLQIGDRRQQRITIEETPTN